MNHIRTIKIRRPTELVDGSDVGTHRASGEDRHGGGAAGNRAAFEASCIVCNSAAIERGCPEGAVADRAAGFRRRILLEHAPLHDDVAEPVFAAISAFIEECAATFRGDVVPEDALREDRAAALIRERTAEDRRIAREGAAEKERVVRLAGLPACVSRRPSWPCC